MSSRRRWECSTPSTSRCWYLSARARLIAVIVANLQQRGASKPRTVKTLASTISSLFQKQLSEQELATLLEELQAKSYVAVNDTKVSYALPPAEA